jgi:hypothetical protein
MAAIDFKEYPLALTELGRVPSERRIGPVILDSKTGEPFKLGRYTRRWRQVADAAGLPREIWNRDSRARRRYGGVGCRGGTRTTAASCLACVSQHDGALQSTDLGPNSRGRTDANRASRCAKMMRTSHEREFSTPFSTQIHPRMR